MQLQVKITKWPQTKINNILYVINKNTVEIFNNIQRFFSQERIKISKISKNILRYFEKYS